MVEMDFCQRGNKDYLIFACSLTGFIQAYETRNKGSAEAVLKLRQWGANWGLPYLVKTDLVQDSDKPLNRICPNWAGLGNTRGIVLQYNSG